MLIRSELGAEADLDNHCAPVSDEVLANVDESDPHATQAEGGWADSVGGSSPAGMRYRILRPLAKGRLGVVSIARDSELDREVALKEIQDEHADDPVVRARFVTEAEVTGKLEHPSIIPIYGLGHDSTGRPFYAMRLIHGHNFIDPIDRYHGDGSSRMSPGDRTLQMREMLGRFLNVCDAIDYAHSRGVLHRDLKPGNIMLGPYGETLVVDWGLAKSLDCSASDEVNANGPLRLGLEEDSAPTRVGSVLGTLAYMSPEQARGELGRLGPASDIFSLGATLYHILTGRAPYSGKAGEILTKVQECNFPLPRQIKPEISRALEAVCLKAMDQEPSNRYETSRALANEIKLWMAQEPVSCWREPWQHRAGRWVKRHRTSVATASVAFLVATVLIGGGWRWYSSRERSRVLRAGAAAQQDLDAAIRLGGEARGTSDVLIWGQAVAAAERARSRLDTAGGDPVLRQRVGTVLSDLSNERDRVQQGIAEKDFNQHMVSALDAARLESTTAQADGRFNHEACDPLYCEAFREYHIDVIELPVPEAAMRIRSSPLRETLVAALDDWAINVDRERATRLRSIAHQVDPSAPLNAFRDARNRDDLRALVRLAYSPEVSAWPAAALSLLGRELASRGDEKTGLELLARSQKKHLANFWINYDLAMIYQEMKPPQPDQVVRYLTVAAALRPESSVVHNNLGNALSDNGRVDEAISEYRIAIGLKPDDFRAHDNLGIALAEKGRTDEAIAEHRTSIRLKPDYSNAHYNLGVTLSDIGGVDEAIAEYRIAIGLKPDDSDLHCNLGIALAKKGRTDDAIAEYRIAIGLKPDDSDSHCNLGDALSDKGQLDEAIAEYRTGIRLKPDDPRAHYNLGIVLAGNRRTDDAIAEYRIAVRLKPDDRDTHFNLADCLSDKGLLDEAISEYHTSVRLKPDDFVAHIRLGRILRDKGLWQESVKECQLAIGLKPDDAWAHCDLGIGLQRIGRFDEALKAFERGHGLGQKESNWRHPSDKWIKECRRFIELDAKLAAILKGAAVPTNADEGLELAELCYNKGLSGAAADFYQRAFAAQPELANNSNSPVLYLAASAAALAGTGRGKDNPTPNNSARNRLRKLAFDWLSADFARRAKAFEADPAAEKTSFHRILELWKSDTELASVRDTVELAKLPEQEGRNFGRFWAEVDAMLKKTEAP